MRPCAWEGCPEPAELRVTVTDLEGGKVMDRFEACRPHAHWYATPWRRSSGGGA